MWIRSERTTVINLGPLRIQVLRYALTERKLLQMTSRQVPYVFHDNARSRFLSGLRSFFFFTSDNIMAVQYEWSVPIHCVIRELFSVTRNNGRETNIREREKDSRVKKPVSFLGSVKFYQIVSLLEEMNTPQRRVVHAETHMRIESMFSSDRDDASRGWTTSRTWPRSVNSSWYSVKRIDNCRRSGEINDKIIMH